MENQLLSNFDFVDDFYFSAILSDGEEEEQDLTFQVSDAKYAEGLQFQEALMGSVIISQFQKTTNPSSKTLKMELGDSSKRLRIERGESSKILRIERGESSKFLCEICAEIKDTDEMFEITDCIHSICSDCIAKHVTIKIQQSTSIITCPGLNCSSVLELDYCRTKLPKGVIDLWEEALCMELLREEQKFYCPFKDCSGLLVVDDIGGEVIRKSECPFCHRLFCAQCYVAWHPEVDCEALQRLNQDERGREDLMVMELAKDNKWRRCPHCKFYVERTEGCPHITCRCKFEFCYGCGSEWSNSHHRCTCQVN